MGLFKIIKKNHSVKEIIHFTKYNKEMPRFTQKTLLEDRVEELTLNKVYERKYQNATDPLYLYELSFLAKQSTDVNHLNIKEVIENDDSDVSTMFSYSKLQFAGCELLGLIKDSLTLTGKRNNHGESDEEISPDNIEISSDVGNNTIDIKYFIAESCDDLQIRFKIMMKSELSISMMEKRNVKIDPEAHTFHRNGFTTENDTCSILHKGFRISSIKNQPESKITNSNIGSE